MTKQEASERYNIPIWLLDEYESWGLCQEVKKVMGSWQYDDSDLERLSMIMTLHDVGFTRSEIETYMHLLQEGDHTKELRMHMAYAPLGQGRKNEMFENPDLVEIAKTHGKTAAQIALRYLMQSGVIVIPKSVHTERIKENFELFDFALTAGEMERLVNMDTAIPMIGNPENPAMVEAAMKW